MNKTIIHQLKTDGRVLDGMSYVIQCGDGSTVVIDGAMYEDSDSMYSYLRALAGGKDPVVDAWFFSHAHPDHTYCCKGVAEKYADKITVKKLIYRFPDEEFQRLREKDSLVQIPAFENAVAAFGAEHVIPSAGDRYVFGDTVFDVMFTCADLPSLAEENNQNLNDTSLVLRLSAAGQTVLFLGDVQEAGNMVMMKKYGKALKSDVCQVAHHGYYSSCSSFYDLVDPEILLWPCSVERHAEFIDKVVASRHLAGEMNVKDIYLLGHGTVALEMPIRPRKEPYLPKGKVLPPIEARAELTIPKAYAAPDLHDPLSSTWNGCEWRPVDGGLSYRPTVEGLAEFKAMWKEDCLYLNVRVNRPFHSNPARVSSANCDCVRVYLTDRAITDRNKVWPELEQHEGYYSNIKLYAEEKEYLGQRFCTMGGRGNCECGSLVQESCHYLTACIRLGSKHVAGDRIGLNIEVDCVSDPQGSRTESALLIHSDRGGAYFVFSPCATVYCELQG